jgi:hypothetical protein
MMRALTTYAMRLKCVTLTAVIFAAFAGVTATALGYRPATAHGRSSMAQAIQQWIRPYGGGNCRLIKQRVSTVGSAWASAWVGGYCGRGSDDIHGDLVIFHHNGQDRPGVWRVKGVYSEGEGPCEEVPTPVLVDLGVAGNAAVCARTWREARAEELHRAEQQRQEAEAKFTHELETAENNCAEQGPGDRLVGVAEGVRGPNGSFECQTSEGLVWVAG